MRFLTAVWAALPVLAAVPFSHAAGDYEIPWWVIGGGGAASAGGTFSLNGSFGQTLSGTLTGGTFTLQGGFSPGLATTPAGLCGDANLDTSVDVSDAVRVLRSVVGLDTLTGPGALNADTNGDTSIDVVDATAILRITVGLQTSCGP